MLLLRRSSAPLSLSYPPPNLSPCHSPSLFLPSCHRPFPAHSQLFVFHRANTILVTVHSILFYLISIRGQRASAICSSFHSLSLFLSLCSPFIFFALMHGSVSFPTRLDLTPSFFFSFSSFFLFSPPLSFRTLCIFPVSVFRLLSSNRFSFLLLLFFFFLLLYIYIERESLVRTNDSITSLSRESDLFFFLLRVLDRSDCQFRVSPVLVWMVSKRASLFYAMNICKSRDVSKKKLESLKLKENECRWRLTTIKEISLPIKIPLDSTFKFLSSFFFFRLICLSISLFYLKISLFLSYPFTVITLPLSLSRFDLSSFLLPFLFFSRASVAVLFSSASIFPFSRGQRSIEFVRRAAKHLII